jgi:hypothetical protein
VTLGFSWGWRQKGCQELHPRWKREREIGLISLLLFAPLIFLLLSLSLSLQLIVLLLNNLQSLKFLGQILVHHRKYQVFSKPTGKKNQKIWWGGGRSCMKQAILFSWDFEEINKNKQQITVVIIKFDTYIYFYNHAHQKGARSIKSGLEYGGGKFNQSGKYCR